MYTLLVHSGCTLFMITFLHNYNIFPFGKELKPDEIKDTRSRHWEKDVLCCILVLGGAISYGQTVFAALRNVLNRHVYWAGRKSFRALFQECDFAFINKFPGPVGPHARCPAREISTSLIHHKWHVVPPIDTLYRQMTHCTPKWHIVPPNGRLYPKIRIIPKNWV